MDVSAGAAGKWMALTPVQAAKAYDGVRDTYSRDGMPTAEQSKAYIAMLAATAGLNPDLAPATTLTSRSRSPRPKNWPRRNSPSHATVCPSRQSPAAKLRAVRFCGN